jgi:hypothetical protein
MPCINADIVTKETEGCYLVDVRQKCAACAFVASVEDAAKIL